MSRSRMIRFSALIALLASSSVSFQAQAQDEGAGRAPAPRAGSAPAARATQPGQARPQPANDPAKMKWLLEKWEGQSAKLKTLSVKIYRVDKDPKWNEELHFQGFAAFQSPNLAYLDFSSVQVAKNDKGKLVPVINPGNNKRITKRTETIVCGQNEVWHYLHEGRQIFIFPLAKGERQRALDEGPLPFLFNMKAKEAEERYQMSYLGENEKYYGVLVRPRLPEDQETFKSAYIYLEKTFLLPERIKLITPDGRGIRDYSLELAQANKEIDPALFKGGVYKGWKVEKNPAAGVAQQGQAAGRPGGAGTMPRR